ncbi:MAG: hypothetical protein AAF125_27200, partial [Chloroflexota bacterium]
MSEDMQPTPWQSIRQIHRDYADDYRVMGVILFVLIGLLIFAEDRFSYSMNAYTELLSIIVTVFVVDRL